MIPGDADRWLPREFPGGRLRRLGSADLAAFQAYRGDATLARYQGWEAKSDEEALLFLTAMHTAQVFMRGQWVQLGIADAASNVLIGDIGIHLSEDAAEAEIGFTLDAAAQGRGLATAAVREALRLVFDATPAQRVLGITDSRNARSIRLLERIGFRHVEMRNVLFRGEPCEERIYEIGRAAA